MRSHYIWKRHCDRLASETLVNHDTFALFNQKPEPIHQKKKQKPEPEAASHSEVPCSTRLMFFAFNATKPPKTHQITPSHVSPTHLTLPLLPLR